MAKAKFEVEAGLFIRGQVREMLNTLKNDILYREPDGCVVVDETKGFLGESHFYFRMWDVSDEMALIVQKWYERFKEVFDE